MALDLGELVGSLRLDDTAWSAGLRRSSTDLGTFASEAGAQADTAGQEVGGKLAASMEQALGSLMTTLPMNAKGAVDRTSVEFQALSPALRKAVQQAEAAAKFEQLAPEAREAMAAAEAALRAGGAGAERAAEEAGSQAAEGFSDEFKAGLKDLGKTAGAGIGIGLSAGVLDNMSVEAGRNRLSAQLRLSEADAALAGELAGRVYANNFGEDLGGVNEAVRAVIQNTNLTLDDIDTQPAVEKVLTLVDVFDQDLAMTTAAAGQMVKTGMAKDISEALDIITVGLSGPANKADDLLETFNEYGTQFRNVGIDGATAVGLLGQAIEGGARDADIAADAIKEFSLRTSGDLYTMASDGTRTMTELGSAFELLGLDGAKMQEDIAAGGPRAAGALDTILDSLRNVKNPLDQAAASTALFGTQSEDLGDALLNMDVSSAAASIGQVGGAADDAVNKMGSGAQATIDGYQRKLIDMGRSAIESTGPTAAAAGAVAAFGPAVLGVLGPVGTLIAARAAQSAAAAAAAGAETAASGATVRGWLVSSAAAVAGGVRTAGAWVLAGGVAMATYLLGLGTAVASTVAGWVLMGAQALAQAARMAAAWLIAMGPIGWAIAAIVGIGLLIWSQWDNIKRWTGEAWDWVVNKIKGVPEAIVSFFMNFTLPGLIWQHWDSIRSTAIGAWDGIVGWIGGVPGRIIGAIAGLGGRLYEWGTNAFEQARASAIARATLLIIWVTGLPSRILGAIGGVATLLGEKGRDIIAGLYNGITTKWEDAKDWLGKIGGKVKTAVGNLGDDLKSAGRDIIQGLIDGLVERFEDVKRKVREITQYIKDHKGPKEVDLRLWRPAGNWIMTGLLDGLDDQMPGLERKVGDVMDTLQVQVSPAVSRMVTDFDIPKGPPPAGSASGGRGGDTFHIYETTSAGATAAEVSRRQAFAGVS